MHQLYAHYISSVADCFLTLEQCCSNKTNNTLTHSLPTDHCGLPAEGAVFGGGAGHPDSEGCWQPHPHPHYHMALQWEEGEG